MSDETANAETQRTRRATEKGSRSGRTPPLCTCGLCGPLRSLRLCVCLACLFLFTFSTTVFGATVYMKDGRKIEGEIVKQTDLELRVKKADGKIVVLRQSEVERVDAAPPKAAAGDETGNSPVDARTREYERWLGAPLATTLTELTVVRGDHPFVELQRIAEFAEKTAQHFLVTFGCQATDVLRGADRYGPGRIEIFQFVREEGYLAFCDKVLDRIRDETVDKQRFDFMRRQRGFWLLSPRLLMAQYQGPSDLTTVISAACHKTSHEMLANWKPSGSFMPWWFYEGLASWQEFAVLGETRTYCIEIARPGDYAKPGTPEADEAAKAVLSKAWRAKVKSMVSGRNEKELAVLGKMSLNELVLDDVQQSWSVVDWLYQQGKLREFGVAYKDKRDLNGALQQVLVLPTAGAHEAWRTWVMKTY